MKHLQVNRTHKQGGVASEVILRDSIGGGILATLCGIERPWIDNRPSISCIPSGHYVLIPYTSTRYPSVWAFYGGTVGIETGDRTRCLIHAANFVHQVQGCLALGLSTAMKEGAPCVWRSKDALKVLRSHVKEDECMTCVIEWS